MPESFRSFVRPGTYQWIAPPMVRWVYPMCWGAGSGGSAGSGTVTSTQDFGGAGGAYAAGPWSRVTPGNEYEVVVGAGGHGETVGGDPRTAGGDSSITLGGGQILAKGGSIATNAGFTTPGLAASSVGEVVFSGGSGWADDASTCPGGSSGNALANGTFGTRGAILLGQAEMATGAAGDNALTTRRGRGGSSAYRRGSGADAMVAATPGGQPGGGGGGGIRTLTLVGAFPDQLAIFIPGANGGDGMVILRFQMDTTEYTFEGTTANVNRPIPLEDFVVDIQYTLVGGGGGGGGWTT